MKEEEEPAMRGVQGRVFPGTESSKDKGEGRLGGTEKGSGCREYGETRGGRYRMRLESHRDV